MQRRENESFDEYKIRRAESNKKPAKHYVFVSKELPVRNDKGELVWTKGRTYLNPDNVFKKATGLVN